MYKESESDISVCYTINRADMTGEVVVGTLYSFFVVVVVVVSLFACLLAIGGPKAMRSPPGWTNISLLFTYLQ